MKKTETLTVTMSMKEWKNVLYYMDMGAELIGQYLDDSTTPEDKKYYAERSDEVSKLYLVLQQKVVSK